MRKPALSGLLPSIAAATLTTAGCYDFHIIGPEDAPAIAHPNAVTVTITYRRPTACQNSGSPCSGNVVFFASWMRDPNYIVLAPSAGHEMVGTARNVAVNFPGGEPYAVYVHDPFIQDAGTCGVTAERLTIGGESVRVFEHPGGCREQGLIRIDASGKGRNP